MSFLLPLTTAIIMLGTTFDLTGYYFYGYNVFKNVEIKENTQVSSLDAYSAEYYVIQSPAEYRRFLGLDVATGLKVMIHFYSYVHWEKLSEDSITHASHDDVIIAVRLNLRTVKESVSFDVNVANDWKSGRLMLDGSHYVRSLIYGADHFSVITLQGVCEEKRKSIVTSLLSAFGKSGVFDASFTGKLYAFLLEHNLSCGMYSFGTLFHEKSITASCPIGVDELLRLKEALPKKLKMQNDGKGKVVSYEMEPLSSLLPAFPLVKRNSKVIAYLKDIELKLEDVTIASMKYTEIHSALRALRHYDKIDTMKKFYYSLNNAKDALINAVFTMDVTTEGDSSQFEDALFMYGGRNDTTRYRRWLKRLMDQI